MFKQHFNAQDLMNDGHEGIFLRLPDNIPYLPEGLKGKVLRADRVAQLSTRIIPLLDEADEFHEAAKKENDGAKNPAMQLQDRMRRRENYNIIERNALHCEKLAHAYFMAVTTAVYL